MKILFLTGRYPYPLDKGDKLRSYHFIRFLSQTHQIVLVSLSDEKIEMSLLERLKPYVVRQYVFKLPFLLRIFHVLLFLFTRQPLQVGYFYRSVLKKQIRKIIAHEKPDVIFCQLLRVAQYVENIPIFKILDYQDCLSLGMYRRAQISGFFLKQLFLLEYRRLRTYEQYLFQKFDRHIIISEADRDAIHVQEKDKIQIIRNGVDFSYYDERMFSEVEKKYTLLFTGNMSYPPNVHCALFIAREVLPLIHKHYPDVTFVIAGKSPVRALRALRSKHIIVTDWVRDLRTIYAESKIFIAPLQIGTGLQNKLLEAMAMKLPCITSSLANASLGATPNVEVLIGDSANEIVNHIISLLNDEQKARQIALNGFMFVHNRYSWEHNLLALHQLLRQNGYEKNH